MRNEDPGKIWRKSTRDEQMAGERALRQKGPGMPEKWHRASLPAAQRAGGGVHLGGRWSTRVPMQGQSISWGASEGIPIQLLVIICANKK